MFVFIFVLAFSLVGVSDSFLASACPSIISRSQWSARQPTETASSLSGAVRYAFIHHSDTPGCNDVTACSARVRSFQDWHMDTYGWSDIGYSFIIGGDGSVYEGVGWDAVGFHTYGYNSKGLGFCLVGNFTTTSPSPAQLTATQDLIECGVSKGKIQSSYLLRGHRDVVSTSCPGDKLYSIIKGWPHY